MLPLFHALRLFDTGEYASVSLPKMGNLGALRSLHFQSAELAASVQTLWQFFLSCSMQCDGMLIQGVGIFRRRIVIPGSSVFVVVVVLLYCHAFHLFSLNWPFESLC